MVPTTRDGGCLMNLTEEIWKQVPDYPFYYVSSLGRVKSVDRVIVYTRGGKLHRLACKGTILKPTRKSTGYLQVVLVSHLGCVPMYKAMLVHKLVLLTFVGPCPNGCVARHFPDRNGTNNRLDNLQWGTHQQNQRDRVIHGTHNRGDRQKGAKLTWENVEEIRKVYKPRNQQRGGVTRKELANRYGVSKSTIDFVLSEDHWKPTNEAND